MTILLTLTDNRDGSGAVATITGSVGGSANTVYTQQLAATSWTSSGSRTGDGTVALALPLGTYLAYVSNVSVGITTLSNVVYFNVTLQAQAVHWRCMSAVNAKIAGLTMTGSPTSPNANMLQQLSINDDLQINPMIWITCDEATQEHDIPSQALTGADRIAFPVVVTLHDTRAAEDTSMDPTYLLWREQMIRALRNHRLDPTIIPELGMVWVQERMVVDRQSPKYQNFRTGFIAWCLCSLLRQLPN